jgi:hypothetical protein
MTVESEWFPGDRSIGVGFPLFVFFFISIFLPPPDAEDGDEDEEKDEEELDEELQRPMMRVFSRHQDV